MISTGHDPTDFGVFKRDKNECKRTTKYTTCDTMNQLLVALKHYSMLKMNANTSVYQKKEALTRFVNDVYKGLIDDYIHFKEHHGHELEQITDGLIQSSKLMLCDLNKCEFTTRHYQATRNHTITTDSNLTFYEETFDGLHFHLFHCFDAGLRSRVSNGGDEREHEPKDNDNFDVEFARMNRTIIERHHTTSSFERYQLMSKDNKFNMLTPSSASTQDNRANGDDDTTYLDEAVRNLIELRVVDQDIKKWKQFISEQEYDSDALAYDHGLIPNDNITKCTQNQQLLKELRVFITDT
eukprot:247869_1